ncbi:hypothetical protein E2562_018223 [Oryza meyeriana var. granulata]|uniref:Uncharacterized protein n=1 Tax=Oryza meyeriana var. granulata TaxID=110450 RepID=A0A6G1CFR5_9ORYZ|nr:hypothetical protein E2562_018223 [Oryza meyeriana var. granulata]
MGSLTWSRRLASCFHFRLRPAPVALLHLPPPWPSPVHPPLVGPTAPSLPLRGLLLPLSPLCFASPDASSSFSSLSPPPLSSSAAATRLLDGLNWRRVGFGKSWFASEASTAELVEIPLAQTGEGIAECELLHWIVSEIGHCEMERQGTLQRNSTGIQVSPVPKKESAVSEKAPLLCKPKQRASVRTRSFTTRASSNPGGANMSIPKQWYNLVADLLVKPPQPLHPQTHQPLNPSDLAPLFPDKLIRQEVTEERFIDKPEEIANVYKLWRPTPLVVRMSCALLPILVLEFRRVLG